MLVNSNGIGKIGQREGVDPWGEYWRFTTSSTRRLFHGSFRPAKSAFAPMETSWRRWPFGTG
jgi:hypothetical protein